MENIKILIVDDEPDLLEVCVDSFEMKDFICFSAENGQVALDILEQNPDINIVVSDANMPVTGGMELLEKMVERAPGVKFFLATGDIDASADDIISKGGTGLLSKPYDIDDAVDKIKSLFLKSNN